MALTSIIGTAKNGASALGSVGSTVMSGVASTGAQGWAAMQGTGENGAAIGEIVAQAGQSIALLKAQGAVAKALGFQQLKTSMDEAFAMCMKKAGESIKQLC